MTILRILIVDDEPLARLRLRSLVDAVTDPPCEVVAEAATGSQAAAWLRDHGCDLVLLDVQMPGMDGLQLADSLAQRAAVGHAVPMIVFVTAYAMHALRAFELDAIDYLTKPVRRERLQAALARASQRQAQRAAVLKQSPADAMAAPDADFITITDRGRLRRVPLTDVLYFKAELKYVTLRTAGDSHVLDGALSDLEQRYGDRFLRIHRNALVARWAVRELERHAAQSGAELERSEPAETADSWAVRIVHVDEWLAVSRRQVAAVREALAGNRG